VRDPIAAYQAYSAAWNERDASARAALLERAWAVDGRLFDDENAGGLVGRAALASSIDETHEAMPGLAVTETSDPEMLGDRLRVTWVALQDGVPTFTGSDFVEFDAEGRIARVTMFTDPSAA
jgi:hypothetical protein